MSIPNGWLKQKEHEWLSAHAKKHQKVLEIGSYHGRSTSALVNTSGKVWCVDSWDAGDIGVDDYNEFLANMQPYIDRLEVVRGDSHDVLDSLIDNNETFDMIFIDGGHEYGCVHGDILRALQIITPGGLLCGHDYNQRRWPGVAKAVDELVPSFKKLHGCSLWWRPGS